MQPRVIAILVAQGATEDLDETLAALAAQSSPPQSVVVIDTAPSEESDRLIAKHAPTVVVTASPGTAFGDAVAHALHAAPPPESDDELLWLLRDDSAPDPDALAQLLNALEIAPSVAIAGPKLLDAERPTHVAAFGETLSTLGESVQYVDGELDQGQFDTRDDVLGIAAAGMLVRRAVWTRLGGFDPALPSIDASLDFCVRARLAGHRVVVVPSARLLSRGGPELVGRSTVTARRRHRLARTAQLHRRLVYAPAWAVPLHWLSILPLAIVRVLALLLAKRPGLVGAELAAALRALVDGGVFGARANLRRTRTLGWAALDDLRMPVSELRERRAQAREQAALDVDDGAHTQPVAGFVAGGGLWVVLGVALVSIIVWGSLLGASVLTGGGLLPLSPSVADLWENVSHGSRAVGMGVDGVADPFAMVLAVLGTLTFWAPSYSLVLLWLAAMPLAGAGAFFLARRIASRAWTPAVAAALWAIAPPLLAALAEGRPAAVLAHVLLPWLVLAGMRAPRSWSASAVASILLAVVAACAPALAPALLVLWLVWLLARPASAHRLLGIPVPALVLFAPLVIANVRRGTPLAALADPGLPQPFESPLGWQLALADARGTLLDWPRLLEALGLPTDVAVWIVLALLVPLVALAMLSLFLRGTSRSVPALVMALLGFATAVAATRLELASLGTEAIALWPGTGLSLMWLGLLSGALVALDALGSAARALGSLAALTTAALVIPALGAPFLQTTDVRPGSGRIVPALVSALAVETPAVGTLFMTPVDRDTVVVDVQRGAGATLDDQSTLHATAPALSETERELAELAGNLASRSGFDSARELARLGLSFVVLTPGDEVGHERVHDALNAHDALVPVGSTDYGLLWRFDGEPETLPEPPGTSALGHGILAAQGAVFGVALLLALPTGRRHAAVSRSGHSVDSFEGEPDA